MTDQLAHNLDEIEGGVALEYLPYDWQDLGFDQEFPLGWRDGSGWSSLAADVVPDYLPEIKQ